MKKVVRSGNFVDVNCTAVASDAWVYLLVDLSLAAGHRKISYVYYLSAASYLTVASVAYTYLLSQYYSPSSIASVTNALRLSDSLTSLRSLITTVKWFSIHKNVGPYALLKANLSQYGHVNVIWVHLHHLQYVRI